MEDKNYIVSTFIKRNKPKVPEGFFDHFYETVKSEIDSLEPFAHLNIVKRKVSDFKLSDAYKTQINSFTSEQVIPKQTKGKIIRLTIWSSVAGIAAVDGGVHWGSPE